MCIPPEAILSPLILNSVFDNQPNPKCEACIRLFWLAIKEKFDRLKVPNIKASR
jgi:hypothetical protein